MEAVPSGRCPVGERHGTGASTVKHVCEDGPAVSALPVRAQLGELARRKTARDAPKCGRIVGKNGKCSRRRGRCDVCAGGDAGRTLPGVFIAGGVYSCSNAGIMYACSRAYAVPLPPATSAAMVSAAVTRAWLENKFAALGTSSMTTSMLPAPTSATVARLEKIMAGVGPVGPVVTARPNSKVWKFSAGVGPVAPVVAARAGSRT